MMTAAVFGICMVSASCSTTEPAPAARPAAQPIAAQPAAGNSGTTATAQPGATPASVIRDRELRAQGYTAETHKGVTVYCRGEAPIGTRFEQKHCATAEDLEAAQQAGQDFAKRAGTNSK
jgi:hypothetical protein